MAVEHGRVSGARAVKNKHIKLGVDTESSKHS
jgi:hypothetical protein